MSLLDSDHGCEADGMVPWPPHSSRLTHMQCQDPHRHDTYFELLPLDQGGHGRHRCAGCAYEAGYRAGFRRDEAFHLNLDDLPESQAGSVRHRSPHAAFAQGYVDGVRASYES